VEPYLLGYRLALGLDLFQKTQKSTNFVSYDTKTVGGSLRLGFSLREDLSLQLRYSVYRQQVLLPPQLMNCNNLAPDFISTFPTPAGFASGAYNAQWAAAGFPAQTNCFSDGEASLAVRRELGQGPILTSLVGYTLAYNTLDNNRNPTSGTLAELRQDFAGVGGDVQYLRTTGDVRSYYEVLQDVVGFLHLQGGYIHGWGSGGVRMLDHFQMGPQLVRGFAPSGIGPRDQTQFNFNGTPGDALGGSLYWGTSVEVQTPLFFAPKDVGIKIALFADAGSLWHYVGPTSWLPPVPGATGETLTLSSNSMFINSSVGAGVLWASPFGPIRFDFAYPITKTTYDRKQWFRFSGGTSF
jgi:outer membrane protein insertion porin family